MAARGIGFGSGRASDGRKEIERLFSPEFRNRLDEVVTFAELGPDVMGKVVDKFVKEVEGQLAERKVKIELDADARAWLAREGLRPRLRRAPDGAHDPGRAEGPDRRRLLFGALAGGGVVRVERRPRVRPAPFRSEGRKAAADPSPPPSGKSAAARRCIRSSTRSAHSSAAHRDRTCRLWLRRIASTRSMRSSNAGAGCARESSSIDDMPAELALHGLIGRLTRQKLRKRIRERLHHPVEREPAEVAAVLGAIILRLLARQLREIRAAFQVLSTASAVALSSRRMWRS